MERRVIGTSSGMPIRQSQVCRRVTGLSAGRREEASGLERVSRIDMDGYGTDGNVGLWYWNDKEADIVVCCSCISFPQFKSDSHISRAFL